MEKLIKAWGSYPPGTMVTTDLADVKTDGALRVGAKRMDALRAGGYLEPRPARDEEKPDLGRSPRRRAAFDPGFNRAGEASPAGTAFEEDFASTAGAFTPAERAAEPADPAPIVTEEFPDKE